MSDSLLSKPGIDPAVASLANDIKTAQGPEIATMQGWLKEWGITTATMPGHDMSGHGGMPGHDMSTQGDMPGMGAMPGMMTDEDMAALQRAQGVDAARLFLTQMIAHHEGAIAMAQNEIDSGQFTPAVEMARAITASQQKEIGAMQELLRSL